MNVVFVLPFLGRVLYKLAINFSVYTLHTTTMLTPFQLPTADSNTGSYTDNTWGEGVEGDSSYLWSLPKKQIP